MELEDKLPFDENSLKIECKKTSQNMIVTVVDIRDDTALLTYLFDDSTYIVAPHHVKRMAKEAWNDFCQNVEQIGENWIPRFEVKIKECMGI